MARFGSGWWLDGRFSPALTAPGIGGGATPYSPLSLFASGEQGIWLDPGDFTRYMGELGPELSSDPGFDSAAGWTTGAAVISGSAVTGGTISVTRAPTQNFAAGDWVEVVWSIDSITGGFAGPTIAGTTLTAGYYQSQPGTYRTIYQVTTVAAQTIGVYSGFGNTAVSISGLSVKKLTSIPTATLFQDSAGTTPVTAVEQPVGKILDKSGRGNHVTQATTAQKPVLSARKNLLLRSEELDNASWTKGGSTVTANAAADSTGEMTLDKIVESAAAATHFVYQAGVGTSQVTVRCEAKAGGRNFLGVMNNVPNAGAVFDLSAGTFNVYGGGTTASMTSLGGGLYSCVTTLATPTGVLLGVQNATGSLLPSYLGDGASGIFVGRVQCELGPAATTYQRVTTATDYDTVGFPRYGKFDRVDDNMTAAAGGGGTTGIIVCAAIRAGGAGNARTIWSDRGTNTGYRLSINASNQLVLSAGNGSAHTEVVGPTVTAGTDYVVTGWHDGTNLNVQVNAGAATSAAFGTAAAGTAGFTIGKDNGAATGYYGDRIYEIVYRKDDTSSAGDRTSLITYMAEQAGITL